MTRDHVKVVLDRVLTWPRERQRDVVKILSTMEVQDKSDYHLTAEQAREVRRRLRKKNPKDIPAEEVFALFRRRRT